MPSYSAAMCSLMSLPLAGLAASGATAALLLTSRYGPCAYPPLPLQTGPLEFSRKALGRCRAGGGGGAESQPVRPSSLSFNLISIHIRSYADYSLIYLSEA